MSFGQSTSNHGLAYRRFNTVPLAPTHRRVIVVCSKQHRLQDATIAVGDAVERTCGRCGEKLRYAVETNDKGQIVINRSVIGKA